jgi:hypothetical protein
VEIVATLLLALAAVATAWSSYQATRWNGEQAKAAGRTNYLLGVVLFAVALFFAGMSTKLHMPALRRPLLVLGSPLFVGTVAWMATFPVSVSI